MPNFDPHMGNNNNNFISNNNDFFFSISFHLVELIMIRGPLVGESGEESDEIKQKIKWIGLEVPEHYYKTIDFEAESV